MWDAIKNAIGSIAPWIATTLGGPVAGTAVKALTNALGLSDSEKQTPETILEAVKKATPDQLLALKSAEIEHKEFMTKLGFDQITKLEEIAALDRSNARSRQVSLKDQTPRNLAYILTIGFFSMLLALFNIQIPEANKAIAYSMVGSLGTSWIGAMVYYFGSTLGSMKKTEIIAASQPVDMNNLNQGVK